MGGVQSSCGPCSIPFACDGPAAGDAGDLQVGSDTGPKRPEVQGLPASDRSARSQRQGNLQVTEASPEAGRPLVPGMINKSGYASNNQVTSGSHTKKPSNKEVREPVLPA